MVEKKAISRTLKSTNIKQKTACLPKFIFFTMSSSLKNHDFVLDSYTSTEGESVLLPYLRPNSDQVLQLRLMRCGKRSRQVAL